MFVLYDILFFLFAVFYFPYLLIRRKWHPGFAMRFGDLGTIFSEGCDDACCIWIHAVSVGEVLAITGLVRKIKAMFPNYRIVCSTVTQTGNQLARERLGEDCRVIYAPLDLSWIVRKFIRVIAPRIYISTETEIWPNLYTALHRKGVAILQINGRISDKAFKGYNRARFLTRRVLSCVDLFCMQSPLDAQRVQQLGADSQRIRVVGNLKFDNVPVPEDIRNENTDFLGDRDFFIAGSTHPGEEEILIRAYRALVLEFPRLRLIIAPRHVERMDAVVELLKREGYKAVRFSVIQTYNGDPQSVVVVDTIGHLRALYALAKIVFVGKTLAVGGGQNMIEPACLGKPTIVGPMTQNFKDAVRILLEAQALVQVRDATELLTETRDLLRDAGRAEQIGRAARQTVEKHQGATLKTVKAVKELLTESLRGS